MAEKQTPKANRDFVNSARGKQFSRRDMITLVLFVVMIAILVLYAFYYLEGSNTNLKFKDKFTYYNDNWTINYGDQRYVTDLPAYVSAEGHEEIVLTKVLPAGIYRGNGFALRNYHLAVEVRVDGMLVFSYPKDWENSNINLISDEWLMVDLLPQYARKRVEIKYTSTTNTGFDGYIKDIYYGNSESLVHVIRRKTLVHFISGLIMMIEGAIFMMLGWLYRFYPRQKENACFGMTMFSLGAWFTDRSKFPMLTEISDLKFVVSFALLLMVAPFTFLYCYYKFENTLKKHSRLGFQVTMGFAMIIIAVGLFGELSMEAVSTIIYLEVFVAGCYVLYLFYRYSFGKESEGRIKAELTMDRSIFIMLIIVPLAVLAGTMLYQDLLWTETSMFTKGACVLLTLTYGAVVLALNYMDMKERNILTQKLHDSQLELLMGQIQPHFLFNTLSSIRTLIKINPDVAYNMVYDFSNYLRANVDNITNLEGIGFGAEVDHIKSYVNIEKVRYGERLNVEYDVRTTDFTVPPLSIQPLVENAIKHGLFHKHDGGTVWVRSYENEDAFIVEVEDDGIGFDSESMLEAINAAGADPILTETNRTFLTGNGSEVHVPTGMRNIILRLRELSGADIKIDSVVGEGTRIQVIFPKEHNER